MKSKKLLVGLAAVLVVFTSCVSTGINKSILSSDTFEVTELSYLPVAIYDPIESKVYDIKDIYEKLPFEEMKESFYNIYDLELSFDLYDESDSENFVADKINYYGEEIEYQVNRKESDSNQTVSVSFVINPIFGYISWAFNVSLPNGRTRGIRVDYKEWSLVHEYVNEYNSAYMIHDTDNTSLVIERIDGVNAYSFIADNGAGIENVFYVPADQEVTIVYSVYDSGNFLVEGGTWEHQVQTFTFEKGKRYKLKYASDRRHFLKYDWTVSLVLEEI